MNKMVKKGIKSAQFQRELFRYVYKTLNQANRGFASDSMCKPSMENAWKEADQEQFRCVADQKDGRGLILGVYTPNDEKQVSNLLMTRTAMKYNTYTCGKLIDYLRTGGSFPKLGDVRTYYNLDPTFNMVTVVGLGHECYGYNKQEQRDEAKEAIRIAVGAGCRAAQRLDVNKLYVECLSHTESAAEGAALALWVYQDLKNKGKKKKIPYLGLYDDCDWTGWQIGLEKASAQNFARQLMETPSNMMTPIAFALSTVESLCKAGVNVEVRVREWAKENNMNSFLAVSRGSFEAPIFMELSYNGCDPCQPPVILIGKGVTFDAGGLCMKTCDEMKHMRGDMGGAACVVATIRAVAMLKLPINVRGLIPLCENMPGASASKPGDIVRAMNGKTILISDTALEGQLMLADALCYAQKYSPKFILDIGTMTPQIEHLMGSSASGVFTNCDNLWASIKAASIHTGDRIWRFPLWSGYVEQILPPHVCCDLCNVPEARTGIPCTTAAFLSQFICYNRWVHIDTYGVMVEIGETPYLRKGMSGRPTRTLIEFLAQFACKPTSEC